MAIKNAFLPIPLTSFNAASLVLGTYKVINSSGLDEACAMIRIFNHGKNIIFISFDGILDHDYLRSGKDMQIDTSFSTSNARFKKITNIYVRGPASIGKIYLSAYYV